MFSGGQHPRLLTLPWKPLLRQVFLFLVAKLVFTSTYFSSAPAPPSGDRTAGWEHAGFSPREVRQELCAKATSMDGGEKRDPGKGYSQSRW